MDIARNAPPGRMRILLIDAAQTWLRLAEEQEASPRGAVQEPQASIQQEQQIEPEQDED